MFQCHSFTCSCPVFPAAFIEETIFAPLYILISIVKNKVYIGMWVYLWTFYLLPWSVFLFLCQYHTILMNITLQYSLKSGRLIPPVPFFFLKIALANWGLLCFHMNCEIFWSSSVKNAIVYWCYFKLTAHNSDSYGMVLSLICCLLLYTFLKKLQCPSIFLMGRYSSVYLCSPTLSVIMSPLSRTYLWLS